MVPEIKADTDYFIGVVGDYFNTNVITFKFSDGQPLTIKGANKKYLLKGSNDTKVCLIFHVQNHDRENFSIDEWPKNCLTTNYCLCEKF